MYKFLVLVAAMFSAQTSWADDSTRVFGDVGNIRWSLTASLETGEYTVDETSFAETNIELPLPITEALGIETDPGIETEIAAPTEDQIFSFSIAKSEPTGIHGMVIA